MKLRTAYRRASLGLALVGLTATATSAQSLALRFGPAEHRLDGALWDENRATFTVEPDSFDGLVYGAEVGLRLTEHFDVRFGVESSSRSVATSYREFVRDDGTEIVQELRLRMTPVTAGLRAYPFGSDRRILPFVAGGAGAYVHDYREEGEFIDLETFDVFVDSFVDRNVAFGGYLGAGVELAMTEGALLLFEYRRHWASGMHREDFEGFGSYDFRSSQVGFGVELRF